MLMRNARLAELRTAYDEASITLTIRSENREAARGDLRTLGRPRRDRAHSSRSSAPTSCAARLRCCTRRATAFPTSRGKVVSIINLASVKALEDAAGASIHPLRFRGNLHVEGWPAWHEFDLLNAEIAIGPRRRGSKIRQAHRALRRDRSGPRYRHRDLASPPRAAERFGHADCGVYGEVIAGGTVSVGDDGRRHEAVVIGRDATPCGAIELDRHVGRRNSFAIIVHGDCREIPACRACHRHCRTERIADRKPTTGNVTVVNGTGYGIKFLRLQ